MLQDSGFTLGVFDDGDLDGRFLGDFNLQTKRGGKILQILAFACQFVASAEVRKVDVALKVLDEVKGMDQVCFPSVQFLHREGEDVEGAAWLKRERHGSDAPANEPLTTSCKSLYVISSDCMAEFTTADECYKWHFLNP